MQPSFGIDYMSKLQNRITVWFLEMGVEALLLSVVLNVLALPYGRSQHGLLKDLLFGFTAVLLVFCTSGYLFTTGILVGRLPDTGTPRYRGWPFRWPASW